MCLQSIFIVWALKIELGTAVFVNYFHFPPKVYFVCTCLLVDSAVSTTTVTTDTINF